MVAIAAAGLRAGLDPLISRAYSHWKPPLERIVGRALGHPLELGPYRGFGPEGLRVGPSRFRAGERDGSTVEVAELVVRIQPLSSWQLRGLALDLKARGVQADLRRNARGRVWELGRFAPGGEPPRISLRFQLPEPSRVRLWGFSHGGPPLAADLQGGGLVSLPGRSLELQGRLSSPGQSGELRFEGQGNWARNHWQLQSEARGLGVAALAPLIPGKGRLGGTADGRLQLQLDHGRPGCQGALTLRGLSWQLPAMAEPLRSAQAPLRCQQRTLTLAQAPWRYGPWQGRVQGQRSADGTLSLVAAALPPASLKLGERPLKAGLVGRWSQGALQLQRLSGAFGGSRLRASGRVGSSLELQGGWWLDPADFAPAVSLPAWLAQTPLQGSLQASGPLGSPRLAVRAPALELPLLGPASVALSWDGGALQLQELRSAHLLASATLPLQVQKGRGLVGGALRSRFQLRDFPLPRLDPLLGTRLAGRFDADGSISGSLGQLRQDLTLRLHRPGAGPLRLQDTWSGTLQAGEGRGLLRLSSEGGAPQGRLEAHLDRRWQPHRVLLERGEGRLGLEGSPERYRWSASAFPLHGLAVVLGAAQALRSLEGTLSGQGSLGLRPLAFDGTVAIERPALLGITGRRLQAQLRYADRRYSLKARLDPLVSGSLAASLEGRWMGPFQARLQGRHLGAAFFRELLAARSGLTLGRLPERGRASDLGELAIETLGRSINEQLQTLAEAQALAATRDRDLQQAGRRERLERLQMAVDSDLILSGPDVRQVRVDLAARGHLWLDQRDRDQSLASDPFVLRLQGPLRAGEGSFELSGLSLALLRLLTPVPEALRGSLSARGRYRLGEGLPQLAIDLGLRDAALGTQPLLLQQGRLELSGRDLAVNLGIKAASAAQGVTLVGRVPLDPERTGLELRLASRDDGLLFLTRFAGSELQWRRGSADVQLLVRGSLRDPIANGFLRLRNGECRLIGQTFRAVQATVLFDASQLLVQELSARIGSSGSLRAEGRLGLVRPLDSAPGLAVDLRAVPFSMARVNARADGRVSIGGSLLAPRLGGSLAIGHGTINARPAGLAEVAPASKQPAKPTSLPALLEAKWDFREPLVLLGPDVESPTALSLEDAMPRLPWLGFDGLQVRLGPDLRVVLPNVANFSTGGSLRISGRLDPSLRASGVVKLLGGRLNLFTTSFSLDPDAPNVAVFTPSLGLIPYLDIALRTRIADSLNVLAPSGVGDPGATALANTQMAAQGGFSSLNQLSLILVTVSVSGPADRLVQNLNLRSSPPLPQERLVALIGGNSLAGLSGGGAGAALATALGQTLLSPLLSTLSDAMGQRVSLALYPTYVNPQVDSSQELRSRRIPPQLVLGAEMGYDLTDR
ncbi:MAG: translocation/assembly module TamB domain-containing protein, partial [Cyanobium sp.]